MPIQQTVFYEETFWVKGVMCEGCGCSVAALFSHEGLPKTLGFPADTVTAIYSEPDGIDVHRCDVRFSSTADSFCLDTDRRQQIRQYFQQQFQEQENLFLLNSPADATQSKNLWLNPAVNLVALAFLITLTVVFPPSLFLTVGSMCTTLLSLTVSSRHYLKRFYDSLWNDPMATAITAAYATSAGHMVYETTESAISGAAMLGMHPFMMLGTFFVVNVMDSMKIFGFEKTSQLRQSLQKIQEAHRYLTPGETITVAAGECFPTDCELQSEQAWLDTSVIDGELLQFKRQDDTIPSGAINRGEAVSVTVTKTAYQSTWNQILQRANRGVVSQETNQRINYIYFSLIALSLALAIIFPIALGFFTVSLLLQNIIGLLLVACPCTPVIAAQFPKRTLLFAYLNHNIPVNNPNFVAQDWECKTIIFDKTGTLTSGNCRVAGTTIIDLPLLNKIYALERQLGSYHPIGKAIISHIASDQSFLIENAIADSCGISGVINGEIISIGNKRFLEDKGIVFADIAVPPGLTPVYVAKDKQYVGAFFIEHSLRPGIQQQLQQFKEQGKRLVMITGDTAESAQSLNQRLNNVFDPGDIHAGLKWHEKKQRLEALSSSGDRAINLKKTRIIGDGGNDLDAFRYVSEHGGESCAIERHTPAARFASLVLDGSLDLLPHHDELLALTTRIKKQNQIMLLLAAIGINIAVIAVSICGMGLPMLLPLIFTGAVILLSMANSYRIYHKTAALVTQYGIYHDATDGGLTTAASVTTPLEPV